MILNMVLIISIVILLLLFIKIKMDERKINESVYGKKNPGINLDLKKYKNRDYYNLVSKYMKQKSKEQHTEKLYYFIIFIIVGPCLYFIALGQPLLGALVPLSLHLFVRKILKTLTDNFDEKLEEQLPSTIDTIIRVLSKYGDLKSVVYETSMLVNDPLKTSFDKLSRKLSTENHEKALIEFADEYQNIWIYSLVYILISYKEHSRKDDVVKNLRYLRDMVDQENELKNKFLNDKRYGITLNYVILVFAFVAGASNVIFNPVGKEFFFQTSAGMFMFIIGYCSIFFAIINNIYMSKKRKRRWCVLESIIPILMMIAILLAFAIYSKDVVKPKKVIRESCFKNRWANRLHSLSYYFPFTLFIDEKGEDKRTKEIKSNLFYSGLNKYFNYRSFATFKTVLFIFSMFTFFLLTAVVDNWHIVANALFGETLETSISGKAKAYLFVGILAINLLPSFYLRQKTKSYMYNKVKDLPIIQLFIILLLRSKRPLSEVIFLLSKINTHYKDVFYDGYRIFVRNKKEGLQYIERHFQETKFVETINILNGLEEYSKSESINLLENNLNDILEDNKNIQRQNDLNKSVFSQLSLFFPYLALITLGFLPLVRLGLSIMEGVGFQ